MAKKEIKEKPKQEDIKEAVNQIPVEETVPAQKNGELSDAERAYMVHKISTR